MSRKGIEPVRGAEAAICVAVGDQLVGMGTIDIRSFRLETRESSAAFLVLSDQRILPVYMDHRVPQPLVLHPIVTQPIVNHCIAAVPHQGLSVSTYKHVSKKEHSKTNNLSVAKDLEPYLVRILNSKQKLPPGPLREEIIEQCGPQLSQM